MTTDDIATKLQRQIEFYFSDANLRKDKFMRQKLEADSEGFIGLDVLLSFKRVKALTEDAKVLADALGSSAALTLDNEKTKVRRVEKFDATTVEKPEDAACIVCATGLPKDATLDEVIALFSTYGKVTIVRFRRLGETFSGVAWVEFESAESANAAAAATVTFDEKPIKVTLKTEFLDKLAKAKADKEKEKENADGNADGKEKVSSKKRELDAVNESYLPNWEQGTLLGFVLTTPAEDASTVLAGIEGVEELAKDCKYAFTNDTNTAGYVRFMQPVAAKALEEISKTTSDAAKFHVVDEEEMKTIKESIARERARFDYESGRLVKFTFTADTLADDVDPKSLKPEFAVLGDVKFLDLKAKGESGVVRFMAPVTEEALAEKGPKTLADKPISLSILQDEDEWAYWKKIGSNSSGVKRHQAGGRGGRGGRGRGRGRGRGGKRSRD